MQNLSNIQEQTQRQRTALTQKQLQQMQFMGMLEMSIQQLEEQVKKEIDDNPALEATNREDYEATAAGDSYDNVDAPGNTDDYDNTDSFDNADNYDNADNIDNPDNFDNPDNISAADNFSRTEREERDDILYAALEYMDKDDSIDDEERDHRVITEQTYSVEDTLYQQLLKQIAELPLDEGQQEKMEYLLDMLDGDGLLRKTPEFISEEMLLIYGIDCSQVEVTHLLSLLKTLDPAGIGAQSLQECLLIQVERRRKSTVHTIMKRILSECFRQMVDNDIEGMTARLNEDQELIMEALREIRKLNPRPGAALGDNTNAKQMHVVPDFYVETHDDGTVTFTVNQGKLPLLAISTDFEYLIQQYDKMDLDKLRRKEFEAYRYAKSRLTRAKAFIALVAMRYRTLYKVMEYVIQMQKDFFLTGDEAQLRPLLRHELAEKLNFVDSTISRACSHKYVQTEWGIFPMKFFFRAKYSSTDSGEQFTLIQVQNALRQLIDNEDKQSPFSDEQLSRQLAEKGYKVARRTVVKYREQLGYANARKRRIKIK